MAVDPDFFDDAYYRLLEPFHGEAEARRETAALRELLALSQEDRILDLGCGWGRHLTLLREAGHHVVGVDLSVPLLRRAPAGGLLAGDMLDLPLRDATFDVVVNLATSLGLLLDDRQARRALGEARRVLRPGGTLLLEGMHREDVEPAFAPRDEWVLDDGTAVRVRRRWDPGRGISHEVVHWEGPHGSGRKRHSLRVRSAQEIGRVVEDAGFRIAHRYGDWTGEPFGPASPSLIVSARAR